MEPARTTYCWQRMSMSCFLDFFAPHATELWEIIVPACGWGPAEAPGTLSKRAAKRRRDFFMGTPQRNGRVGASIRWSREWDLDPRPAVYESAALPLSYLGPFLTSDSTTDFYFSSLGGARRV